MSPSEFQLRAALHDGEGDAPDADHLIAHAVAVRRERRHRINTVLGGVAAVAVVGAGATLLIVTRGSDSGSSTTAGGRMSVGAAASSAPASSAAGVAGGTTSAAASQADGAGTSGSVSSGGGASTGSRCPAQPIRLMLPGGGGIGAFGSKGPLFDDTVTSLRLCGYPSHAGSARSETVVRGAGARAIITTLNGAPATDSTGGTQCANRSAARGSLELIGSTRSGALAKPVIITIGCPTSKATNGTSVRYLRSLPDSLLRLVVPRSAASGVPGTTAVSPVR